MRSKEKDPPHVVPITLSTEQVYQIYGLSGDFLRGHPEIPRYRAGHRTALFRAQDIERFLEERRIA
jgi:hypothetical protein